MFNVVLVEPEIPPNTGNIGRLCLATRSTLHLVRPLGFSTDDRTLKRAGLDYWAEVDRSLLEIRSANCKRRRIRRRAIFSSRRNPIVPYHAVQFQPGDFLVFGRETKGLPEALLQANAEQLLTIPMHGTRSLNLATAVAIVLFEAVRQAGSERVH